MLHIKAKYYQPVVTVVQVLSGQVVVLSPGHLPSLSCTLWLTASARADNNACTYSCISPLCLYACMSRAQGQASCVLRPTSFPPVPKRFCMLGQIIQREEAKSPSNTFSQSFTPRPASPAWGCVCGGGGGVGVIDSGIPHLKHSSAHDSVSSNKRHRETTRLFSVITQKSLCVRGSSKSRCECYWRLGSKFHINIWMDHLDEQEREMIGSETSPRLHSVTMSLFQPRTHTLLNVPV